METIFDVPAHPLTVHFPVVAIPLLSILAVAVVARPSLRQKWRHPLAALAVITAISTIIAAGSGQALADAIEAGEYIDKHRSLGETLRIFVVLLGVSLLGLLYVTKPGQDDSTAKTINIVVSTIVVVMAALSFIWVIRTGHEGSSVHWEGFI